MSKIKIDRKQIESVFEFYQKEDSLLVTGDGNVFLMKGKGMCKSHCRRVNCESAHLTREAFESGVEEIDTTPSVEKASTSTEKSTTENTPSGDDPKWEEGKWGEIIDFAKSQGLDPITKMNKGKALLIKEVEEFIASKEIGANDTTNHITE